MNPPAGWHPDPYDSSIDRYWDGLQWTAHTRPKGAADPTQAFAPVEDPASPNPDEPAKRRRKWPWITGAAAVVGVLAIGAFGNDSSQHETTPVVATSTAAPTTTVAPTTPRATTSSRITTAPTTTAPTTTTVAIVPLVPQHVEETSTPVYTPPRTTEPAYVPPPTTPEAPAYTPPPETYEAPAYVPEPTVETPSSVYYKNCAAARAAGAAPLYAGEPGYRSGLDRDNDGVACES